MCRFTAVYMLFLFCTFIAVPKSMISSKLNPTFILSLPILLALPVFVTIER